MSIPFRACENDHPGLREDFDLGATRMAQWLYGLIKKDDADRTPDFARQSHLNWARALSYEIVAEHGGTADGQWASLRAHFQGTVKPRRHNDEVKLANVFEPLFSSIQWSASLLSLATRNAVDPWECPSATVTWYYANYNAFRAMLAASNDIPADTHAAAIRALNGGVRRHLPHPFDMLAHRERGERYSDSLPHYPDVARAGGQLAAINGAFAENRIAAQTMLLEYLQGTAAFWRDATKEQILGQGRFPNFRTNAAKEERDRRLKEEVNFLDCAFRYRGKANYRDAIFLSYGHARAAVGPAFVRDLARSARFATIMAWAYIERRYSADIVNLFAADLRQNFPGLEIFGCEIA